MPSDTDHDARRAPAPPAPRIERIGRAVKLLSVRRPAALAAVLPGRLGLELGGAEALSGDLVEVEDVSGRFIGRGYINTRSNITVRILTWDPNEQVGYRFFRQRLNKAIEMYRPIAAVLSGREEMTEAYDETYGTYRDVMERLYPGALGP